MAIQDPSDESPNNSPHRKPASQNPFITFRRYTDEQVASLLNLVGSLSEDVSRSAREQQRRLHEDMQKRSEGTAPSDRPNAGLGLFQALEQTIRDAEKELGKTWPDWQKRVEQERQEAEHWRERSQATSRHHSSPAQHEDAAREVEVGAQQPYSGQQNLGSPLDAPSSTFKRVCELQEAIDNSSRHFPSVSYMLTSNYSPLELELRDTDGFNTVAWKEPSHWRDAFEDLIRCSKGEPMRSAAEEHMQEPAGPLEWLYRVCGHQSGVLDHLARRQLSPARPNSPYTQLYGQWPRDSEMMRYITARDDMWELKKRTLFQHSFEPFSWGSIDHPVGAFSAVRSFGSESYADDDVPETEEELYKRAFGIELSEQDKLGRQSSATSCAPWTEESAEKPSIMSMLTKTERTVQPDGTVTTKVVLKKRFTDGTEENSETVHTEPRAPKDLPNGRGAHDVCAPQQQHKGKEQKEEKKQGGWFWSS